MESIIDTMEEEDLNALKIFKEEVFRNPRDLANVSDRIIKRQRELEETENNKTLDNSNDVRDNNNDERDF